MFSYSSGGSTICHLNLIKSSGNFSCNPADTHFPPVTHGEESKNRVPGLNGDPDQYQNPAPSKLDPVSLSLKISAKSACNFLHNPAEKNNKK